MLGRRRSMEGRISRGFCFQGQYLTRHIAGSPSPRGAGVAEGILDFSRVDRQDVLSDLSPAGLAVPSLLRGKPGLFLPFEGRCARYWA